MKTLYLECSMGAAGDMLSAALYELLDDKEAFIDNRAFRDLISRHFIIQDLKADLSLFKIISAVFLEEKNA